MPTLTSFERALVKTFRASFGQNTQFRGYGDDDERNTVIIVRGIDFPVVGVTSYASVGLYKNIQDARQVEVMVEIVAACATATPHVDNLVASCVFDSVKNGSSVIYGSCIRNIIPQYEISQTLKHVTFVAPFLWEELSKIEIEGSPVYCLMMLPISDAEAQYLQGNGIDALERHFTEKQIDVFDISRPSAVEYQ
jgi:antitoxin YqcF